ncbi:DUF2207 domain-containing protein [Luteimonas sp. MC1895]|uniref:DUF2207 domain-containing protein n=1 Tax=Luteimonas sp. MC1895 TaxID=2819513 RepID=UPI0018F0628C|nr:DUF2207 domain-containing protein [Luteimonas sp. MC1895]MBJ6980035.1 DUF2207 domain-containing protein [Luteimonas sp. MC1895]
MSPPRAPARGWRPAWLLAVALALSAAQAAAAERILAYDSVVEVRADGALDVTERIRVRAEGDAIRRGIYRDFPTRYTDRHGNNVVVGFDVVGVERDGRAEPWFTERESNGVRVSTGNDTLLPVPLDTTYTLRYRTTRQLGFFESHDELYWNAIGHGWDFPVETASVEVRLPSAVPAASMELDGWSGAQGAREQGFEAAVSAAGVARWTLGRPLQPREGLTIVLSFPKGIVVAPSRADRFGWLLRDNLSLLAALAGLAALLAFCLKRWHRVGRDPRPGVVIARYEPPRDESPAALRYMVRRHYDNTCLSADLLACAVQGAVDIEQDDRLLGDRWTLQRRDLPAPAIANGDERRLLETLLPPSRPRLELEKGNASHLQAAIAAHGKGLEKRFQPAMFRHNGGSIAIAFLILGATVAASVVLAATGNGGGMPWLLVPVALALAVAIAFAVLVGAPTPEGRRLLDEIEGFKRYLSVAEQDDLARREGPGAGAGAAPPLDAARFEALLPYAVALGVEKAWTAKFTAAVGSAAAAAAVSGIAWYHGRGSADIGRFTSSIGSALGAQIASSSTPPGSSSGGGGGGFSGGGGGGGGGGGR